MRSMKWIAVLSATSAALTYAGIPIEYKRIATAALGVTVMLLAIYNVLRYGPLVAGIERRAATRAAAKASCVQRAPRAVEVPVAAPVVVDEVEEEVEVEQHHRIAISRSTTARPPRVRRAAVSRRSSERETSALVTMLPVEDNVATDDSSHA